jgi:hypothetical protein
MKTPSPVPSAILALSTYIFQMEAGLYDSSLVMTAELLNVKEDCLSEYACTLGKKAQSLTLFKNNIASLQVSSGLLDRDVKKDAVNSELLPLVA